MMLVSKRVEAISGAVALLGCIVMAIDAAINPGRITTWAEVLVVAIAMVAIVGGGGMWFFNIHLGKKTH